jgi:hypothetical protein
MTQWDNVFRYTKAATAHRAEKQRRKVTVLSTNLNKHHHHTKVKDNTNKKLLEDI